MSYTVMNGCFGVRSGDPPDRDHANSSSSEP
jgi:hypothetical protein